MDFSTLLTVKALAELCGATRQTIYRWIETDIAPAHIRMSDDRIYFYPDEAKLFAETRTARKKPRQ